MDALERRIFTPEAFRGEPAVVDPFLIRYLDDNPDEVLALNPREFEEFVAGLREKSGYPVRLGPEGRDGGVDVYAERIGEVGDELVLVQCKRYRTNE